MNTTVVIVIGAVLLLGVGGIIVYEANKTPTYAAPVINTPVAAAYVAPSAPSTASGAGLGQLITGISNLFSGSTPDYSGTTPGETAPAGTTYGTDSSGNSVAYAPGANPSSNADGGLSNNDLSQIVHRNTTA